MEQTTKKVEKQKETVKEKKVYTQEEAYSSSLNYFKGDELAARVWVSKYALKDSYGNIFELNPDDMHHRLASEIARIERNYPNPMTEEQIFEVLRDFKYIVPQGGPMTGIGNDYQIASPMHRQTHRPVRCRGAWRCPVRSAITPQIKLLSAALPAWQTDG